MPSLTEFPKVWGTIPATFATNGTYSAPVDTNGYAIVALYAESAIGSNAGSVTFRASASPTGTGYPVHTEAGGIVRVNPFAAGTYYNMNAASGTLLRAPYLIIEVGTGGTSGHAAGGTIILVGLPR